MSAAAAVAVPHAPPPDAAFERVAHLPFALWLDSASAGPGAEWSFVAADPFGVLQARDGRASWISPDGIEPEPGGPVAALADRLRRYRLEASLDVPFDGGAAGFIGYEVAGSFESLPLPPPGDSALPDLQMAVYDVVVAWKHETGECRVVSTGLPGRGPAARAWAGARLRPTLDWLCGDAAPTSRVGAIAGADGMTTRGHVGSALPARPVEAHPWLHSTSSRDEYVETVDQVIRSIRCGDVYQVNLSQRFSAPATATPIDLHRALREISPAPYGAVIRSGPATVVSSSPERFLRVDRRGRIETRPIKGTRPRSEDPDEDERLARELRGSAKDRAENLMIVDLLRNDLSRICRPGSIRVPALYRLESWATVHHLVSIVRGHLRPGVDPEEILRAAFPCGSVTGAPKIRAMELIARHERVARGPYCGAIGYFGFGGDIDLSVAIRIVVLEAGRATFHAGGGIVADSDPEDEYRETVVKARGIIDALRSADAFARSGAEMPR